jgi:hypothetical protein
VRRYTRETLTTVVTKAGFEVQTLWSWNVLLRPVAAWRRKKATGCDLDDTGRLVSTALTAIITAERFLPVKSLPGISLVLVARRPV